MRATSSLVAAVLAVAACHSDAPAPATRIAAPATQAHPATSAPAAPALAPPEVAAPDVRELVRALAEGVDIDEPRTTEERADLTQAALTGIVRDFETGEALAGVTVVAASSTITGEQVAITDENGNFFLEVPAATYTVTLYYLAQTIEETDVAVTAGHSIHLADTIPNGPAVDPPPPPEPPPPPDSDYYESIPVPGRTFEAALGAAAGSQEDSLGVSFSSHCGLENVYIVDSDDEPNPIELDQ